MLKVKAGDLDKLGLLFERYNRRLFSYFYRLTADRDLSEDLVQNVFERILKYRNTYENSGAFSTWIYRIARNLHIDHYRKNNYEDMRDDLENLDTVKAESTKTEELFDEDNELLLLNLALERLDAEKKETLILSRYQGFKYKEIAAIMHCTESAVKVRIFRALNELKEIISELRKEENYD
jgi:RNA polymerase sigma-70 factor (ECF subfamily)